MKILKLAITTFILLSTTAIGYGQNNKVEQIINELVRFDEMLFSNNSTTHITSKNDLLDFEKIDSSIMVNPFLLDSLYKITETEQFCHFWRPSLHHSWNEVNRNIVSLQNAISIRNLMNETFSDSVCYYIGQEKDSSDVWKKSESFHPWINSVYIYDIKPNSVKQSNSLVYMEIGRLMHSLNQFIKAMPEKWRMRLENELKI